MLCLTTVSSAGPIRPRVTSLTAFVVPTAFAVPLLGKSRKMSQRNLRARSSRTVGLAASRSEKSPMGPRVLQGGVPENAAP